ncbi:MULTISPECIES: DnaJ domain-containing protein [unclassified Synechococcus]|uniref:DnaJ domain-containing protein n=1 Tax=unclassified Synechococcus TaxID=2626047 RepID=UPI0039C0BBEB
MPRKATSTKPKATRTTSKEGAGPDPQVAIAAEIQRLSDTYGISKELLENFARFVVRQLQPPPRLSVKELQKAIYNHFGVKNAAELRKSASFRLATSGMGKLNLSKIDDLERIYRQHIGILPNEEGEEGYGCINGINIFKYDLPWRVFGLDPDRATDEDIKAAFYRLSKIYHPDSPTGDDKIFQRLTLFYKSLTEKFEQWL